MLAAAGAAALFDRRSLVAQSLEHACGDTAWGELLGTLPLSRPDGVVQPFGVKAGGVGLDARQITDLSVLQPDRLITPNSLACIRTEAPPAAQRAGDWSLALSSQTGNVQRLTLEDVVRRARPIGAHLLECSGNSNPANFGLMSVSEYDGVPLADIVARAQPASSAWGARISGLDPTTPSSSSVTGASWILPLAALGQLGAFLAVRMNGEPLPPDHGAPVRLVVPGWYACSWIKWVNEIRLVAMNEPATSQMQEFAARTHQSGVPQLAREYVAPEIEAAAMPIRIEKRRSDSGLGYRVVGIVWGGTKPIDRLAIRFKPNDAWTSFAVCPAPKTHRVWSILEYRWRPPAVGSYDIALMVPYASVPQRRLDMGFYVRRVRVDER